MNNIPTTEREQEHAEKLEQYLADLERGVSSEIPASAKDDPELLEHLAHARDLYYAKRTFQPRDEFVTNVRQEIREQTHAARNAYPEPAYAEHKGSWMSRLIPFSIAAASLAVIVLAAVSAKTMFQKKSDSNPLVFLQEEAGSKIRALNLNDVLTNSSLPDVKGEPVTSSDGGEVASDEPDTTSPTPPSNSNTNENLSAVITAGGIAPDLSALLDEFDTDIVLAESDVEEELVFAELDDLDLFMSDIEEFEF
ncbi:MAG: hypothetical protein HYV34_03600 [Candidatus Kerfeldbacteria bacterium]|nr:hypothetical protein [Candidatus Kerfeldbacteria bacterium]